MNPADTLEVSEAFNPFVFYEIRNSLNLAIDRNLISKDYFSGKAMENLTPIVYGSNDYTRYYHSSSSATYLHCI